MFQLFVNTNAGNKWLMFNGLSHPLRVKSTVAENLKMILLLTKKVSVTKHS